MAQWAILTSVVHSIERANAARQHVSSLLSHVEKYALQSNRTSIAHINIEI